MTQDSRRMLERSLSAVAVSGRLKDFLDLVAADLLCNVPDDTLALLVFWRKNQHLFEGDDVVIEFSRFLRDHMPDVIEGVMPDHGDGAARPQFRNTNQWSNEFAKRADDFKKTVESLHAEITDETGRLQTSLSKYKNFAAVLAVDPYWEEYSHVFGNLDPGEALSDFFGRYYSSEMSISCEIMERVRVSRSSTNHVLISEINEFVKAGASTEEASILDCIVTQPTPSTSEERIALFRKASTTNQLLFEAYIIPFAPSTTDELEVIFRLPFAIDPADNGKPHCTFQIVAWSAPCGDDPDRNASRRDEYRKAARQLSEKLREARRREFGGRSPYTIGVAHDILSTISSGADVQCALGSLREIRDVIDVDAPLLWSVFYLGSIYDLSDSEDLDWLSCIVDDYLIVADSLTQDGDIEASQYLLSFVVFCLIKTMKGNLEPFRELFSLLIKALSTLPHSAGAEALSQAVSFAVTKADASGQSITAHKLRQLQTESRLPSILQRGESDTIEFKSTLRKNLETGKKNDRNIEKAIIKTMAAFFNTKGGCLIVGVNDAGESLGLDDDGFASSDKWQQHLINIVGRDLVDVAPGIWSVSMHRLSGKDVAIVDCKKSLQPVYTSNDGEFFVRIGVTTEKPETRVAIAYIKNNF